MDGLDISTEQLERWIKISEREFEELHKKYPGVRPGWVSTDLANIKISIEEYKSMLLKK